MRWHILKTLLHKEALRHATNRGGLALAGLLVTAALLLAILNPADEKGFSLFGGLHHCYIDYEDENDWVTDLKKTVPPELQNAVIFRKLDAAAGKGQMIKYPTGTGAIQIRQTAEDGKPGYLVWLWHPATDRVGMSPYETWFWRASYDYFQRKAAGQLKEAGLPGHEEIAKTPGDDAIWSVRRAMGDLWTRYDAANEKASPNERKPLPGLELRETPLAGASLNSRAAISTSLVMFSLFFSCVYLMPSLTCEERERGLLLAQAISPANTLELLTAKFLFYPAFGVLLATILSGIHNPQVLANHFYWLTMFTLSLGTLGIGITIACLARNQRSASMGSLCYMLVVALTMLLCQQNNITSIPYLAIEYHAPQIIHATLTGSVKDHNYVNLAFCAFLGFLWSSLAYILFRKRGWQ